MHTNKKLRGAVSVFLVMILVPCIVVTSVFVDIGRVHMSKSMSVAASDLALNSLLTNYDADLNEWYGIVSSCQNIDEFYEASAQLFLRILSSQGLSDDEIVLLSDYYTNATSNDKIYDLLQVECQTASGGMIGSVDGANLSNATMMKDQIVEFMKYRAPIELTTSIIERLNSDSTVIEAIEAEENKALVDDKTEYYEAEGELLAAAFNSYIAIYDYYKEATTGDLTNEKLTDYYNKLTNYKNAYSDIHKLMISNLYNTGNLGTYSRVTLSQTDYNNTYTEISSEVYSRKETIDGVTHYYIDGSKIIRLLDSLETAISGFNKAIDGFSDAGSSLMDKQLGSGASQANTIQWWVQLDKAVNASTGIHYTNSVKNAGQDMLKAYSKVLAIYNCELGDSIPDDWEQRAESLVSVVTNLCNNYLKAGVTDNSDNYLKTVKKLEDVSASNINNIKSYSLTVTIDGQSKTVDQAIPYVQSQLNTMRSELQGYVDLLDIAIDGNENDRNVSKYDKVKSLDQLLVLANNYDISFNNWSNTANTSSTTMGAANREEIANIQKVCQEITADSVYELKTRLTNIRSQIQGVINAIDSMKYGLSSVKDISSFSMFKSAAQSKVSESGIELTNQEISNYASSTFAQLFSPNYDPVYTVSHTDESKYNPEIDPITKQVSTPDLFVFLHDKFNGKSKQDVNDKQRELDGAKSIGENQAEAARNKDRYHGEGGDITKEFSGSGTFNLADGALSGMIDLFESLNNLDITSIRDDLYVTSYIMNMCSYATYEEEGLYKLVEEKKELYLPLYGYRPEKYNDYLGSADKEGTWLSTNVKDSFNKSLTNKLINKSNNVAYEAEVEYILYGGRDEKGNAENVKSVYNNIYGIRYALNLVSGFKNFWPAASNWTAKVIDNVAQAIFIATGGVIPKGATKAVLITILTALETSKDLDRLEAGFPVELFKTTDEYWWVKVPDGERVGTVGGLTTWFTESSSVPNPDNGIFYSDYVTVFVYLGLKSSSGEAMYQRLAEVIQTNLKELTGEDSYSLKKSILYFRLNAEIRVKPLMITLPFFNDYENQMDTKTDWCTYKIATVRGYS